MRWVQFAVVWTFFGIGLKTDLFQSCGHCWVFQICWHIECSTFAAPSFRIWNSSTGIPYSLCSQNKKTLTPLRKILINLDSILKSRDITLPTKVRLVKAMFFFFFFSVLFIYLLYNIVLVLPYIDMNPPWVYMCSPSWIPLAPPSPSHPSGSSQCTSPKHPVSCIEPGLAICFTYDSLHVSMPFFHIIPPSPSPTESKRLFYTSVSLLLSCIQGYHYHLSKFYIYVLVYCIGVFLSGLLHCV